MATTTNWSKAVQPLIEKYGKEPFPLHYKNTYQILVMVLLAAQDSDKHINQVSVDLFEKYPDMAALAKAKPEDLYPFINSVRNFANKANWLVETANTVKKDSAIPLTMEGLTALAGIGRKSANVILRESGKPAEGMVVDLHTERVAHRLGISSGKSREKIEKDMMAVLPQEQWDAGMCMSFLGREICRPTNPKCEQCVMRAYCDYYKEMMNKK